MNEYLCQYISRELVTPTPSVPLAADDDLLTVGALDSIQLMRLVRHLESKFGITIPPEDLLLENFQTVSLISAYLGGRGVTM